VSPTDSGGPTVLPVPDGATDGRAPGDAAAPLDGAASANPFAGNGCAGGTCLNPTCQPLGTPTAIDRFPTTGFEARPSFIPKDVIIPTLHDVPDGADSSPAKSPGRWTASILQYLDANNLHWDFFINTNNACDISGSANPDCVAVVRDILRLHNPTNHTVHHLHLGQTGADGCADAACMEREILGVESVITAISSGGRPYLTRLRPPFGEGATLPLVQQTIAKHAVLIGENIDSTDSLFDDGTNCINPTSGARGPCPTGQDIANVVQRLIGTPGTGSSWGIVGLHGLFKWTRDAIPLLFDPRTGYLARNKFRVGTVEDAVCWKYGKHSWEIVQSLTGQPRGPN
jgi:peptidoglycan/xylan/chitin deacetylase (PgdA/CDA1 family)